MSNLADEIRRQREAAMRRRARVPEDLCLEAAAVEEAIEPLLAGRHPGLQGAVLALLLITWLKGHPEEVRERLLAMHLRLVREGLT